MTPINQNFDNLCKKIFMEVCYMKNTTMIQNYNDKGRKAYKFVQGAAVISKDLEVYCQPDY